MSPSAASRFAGSAGDYARFRPRYPDRILRDLGGALGRDRFQAGDFAVDVGSGTGIFTRQLRALLPAEARVVGIEPVSDMRDQAAATAADNDIAWLDGQAEHLPFGPASVRAVVAATAAHWFDRPSFYAEARRVLVPGGVLAIIEYVRDEASPAAMTVETFLRGHGGPRVYARPDYDDELRSLAGFDDLAHAVEKVTFSLSREAFTGLGLSSSHARTVVAALGRQGAEAALLEAASGMFTDDGNIPYGYIFHALTVRRV